ncbi:MAG: phenolic acid decarboxylase [Methylobacter sp.]|nr:phenolic acid decarboxylase [Methylobacter sp.]
MNKQKAYIHQIAERVFKFSWDEPTGTFVSLTVNLEVAILQGTVVFPRWVIEHPEKMVCHQNDFLDLMVQYRDAGPIYEKTIEDNFAQSLSWGMPDRTMMK